jgi:hypothetical protein
MHNHASSSRNIKKEIREMNITPTPGHMVLERREVLPGENFLDHYSDWEQAYIRDYWKRNYGVETGKL